MAFDVYLNCTGNKQGKFVGTCGQDIKGLKVTKADHTRILAVEYGVEAVLDPSNGMPANKRQHHPLKVLFLHDVNFPRYFKALVTGESFKQVFLTFGQVRKDKQKEAGNTSTQPGEEIAMTIELQNAHLKDLNFKTGLAADRNSAATSIGGQNTTYDTVELVEATFLAQIYIITRVAEGNIKGDDDWAKGMGA